MAKTVGDARYIIDQLAQMLTVSLETMRIVDVLPSSTALDRQLKVI